MFLYLVQWGSIDSRKKPVRFSIAKQEHVWAESKDAARAWGINQDPRKIVKAEEVYAALKVPEMVIYKVQEGDIL